MLFCLHEIIHKSYDNICLYYIRNHDICQVKLFSGLRSPNNMTSALAFAVHIDNGIWGIVREGVTDQQPNNPNTTLYVKFIGEGFGFLLYKMRQYVL